MNILDFLNSEPFSCLELTDAINVVPNSYGRVRELGLFKPRSVATTSVGIEIKNGVLNLLPTSARGGPASQGSSGKRQMKTFTIPHIPHEDTVLAEEVQNVREFGTGDQLQGVMSVVNDKLQTMAGKHDITEEWLMVTALRGVVLDAYGNTIVNYFIDFGVTEKVVDFVLGTAGTDVPGKCMEVLRHVEDNLKGEVMSNVHALVDSAFFDKLVAHPTVKDAYLYQQGVNFLREDIRKRFEFKGITFEEYRGTADDPAGVARKFIPASDGRAFPLGTNDTFSTYYAPADFTETVNTLGRPRYAKMERMKFDRGMELHTQSNPLPMVKRPALLVRLTTSN